MQLGYYEHPCCYGDLAMDKSVERSLSQRKEEPSPVCMYVCHIIQAVGFKGDGGNSVLHIVVDPACQKQLDHMMMTTSSGGDKGCPTQLWKTESAEDTITDHCHIHIYIHSCHKYMRAYRIKVDVDNRLG